ncbi:alpha-N-arabinofuranosidase [Emericellopsis atlantica]|uniref:non-reducing end alpha-L-arabinofuranosidase n=1 Tax=Emericellopsis atlantica TaxID=2614577 RepID=A0A9P7ZK73_9HYPO|nr:alpha-N-arabinofuranosidase [Emericellopsis atlantica]KAG9253629.1 alpha-N-arabinofuranosidase [Emericellopsis atlantica]
MKLLNTLWSLALITTTTLASPTPSSMDVRSYLEARAGQSLEASSPAVSYTNTLIEQRADPHIYKHTDGFYYFTASVPAYDQIILRRAETIDGLRDAPETVVYQRTATEGPGSGYIWAPEIHYIDGKWYIYVALEQGQRGSWAIRPVVFEGTGDDPLEATWENKGVVDTGIDDFSLDMTYFEVNGVRYLAWAQTDPDFGSGTGIFIAKMINPWTVELPSVGITYPTLDWERIGHNVNEGAYVIVRNGKVFLSYSASATDHNYCVGLLTADETADLTDPDVWSKAQAPVFESYEPTENWGPGHNSFTKSEDGLSDVFVYHSRGYKDIVGEPLNNPDRRTRVQKLYWKADGTPDFGIPVAEGKTPVKLAAAGGYLANNGDGEPIVVSVEASLGQTLFRVNEPGSAGEGTVSLESGNLPGHFVSNQDGRAVLVSASDSDEFKAAASFEKVAGLAGEGVSFKSGDLYLSTGSCGVKFIESPTDEGATFTEE